MEQTMKQFIPTVVVLACAVGLMGSQAPAIAEPADDLADLVGARGSSGETQMQARGYQLVRATRVRDQSWTFWWSDVQHQCVSIATSDGRYSSIEKIPTQNCRPGAVSGDTAPTSPQAELLTLVCYGTGQHATYTPHFGYEWNNRTKKYEPLQNMESGNEQFNSGVQIDIHGDEGRIHLTGKMIPPIHSGGVDGWWTLENLRVVPDRITARYRLSAVNSPSIDIDRRSGLINIKGLSGFGGKCDVGDWGAGRKF